VATPEGELPRGEGMSKGNDELTDDEWGVKWYEELAQAIAIWIGDGAARLGYFLAGLIDLLHHLQG
jgi:hypothetical protein